MGRIGKARRTLGGKYPLVQTFKYSNTYWGLKSGSMIPAANRNAMINPNLDAGLPVILGIIGPSASHYL